MNAPVKLGLIGVGGICRHKHIPELLKISDCRITAICDVDEKALSEIGEELVIPKQNRYTDYRDLLACPMVDAVEICTPNHLHVPFALAAHAAGKPFNLEKPLGLSYEQAKPLEAALTEKPLPNMMCFSYRFFPAVRYAKALLAAGKIGKPISVQVEYCKSSAFWEGRRLDWRFVKKYAGSGVIGDLAVHLIDMATWLIGDIREVSAQSGIAVKERKSLDSEEYAQVETEDYCNFLATLAGGVPASFVITRCALGHANTIRYDIFGDKGVISFNLNNPDVLNVCFDIADVRQAKTRTVPVPDEYRVGQEETFVRMLVGKACDPPSVTDGIRSQKIIDALLRSSEEKRWIAIE